MSISNLRNVPDTLLLYSRIITLVEEIYQVSEDENEYEMLRDSESEIYFTEKFRIFEKTFGIEELHELVKRIDQARTKSEYKPSEGKFIFSKKELQIH